MKKFDIKDLSWTRMPKQYEIGEDTVTFVTEPWTDLWQRTYYGFQHDNAPVLQMSTEEQYFSFTVKSECEGKGLFDQCGIAIYLDSDNWAKAAFEYEDKHGGKLGSVVTNHGFSDWSSTDVPTVKQLYYRLSRRESDYLIETSADGVQFKQMRIFHLNQGAGKICFGLYACSPMDYSFTARFSEMQLSECQWEAFHA